MPTLAETGVPAGIEEFLGRWPAVGLAVGVVRHGKPGFFAGHGLADVLSATPISEDTVFRIGSLTKTFTAVAVMQLVERGLVDLDARAADYLHAFRLVPDDAGWRPATVRHLLTHTAGIGEVLRPSDLLRPIFGEAVKAGRPVPPLPEYYRRGLRIGAEPGSRWRYSGHGFATVGQIVAEVSGQPLDVYLRDHVFGPLGMGDTELVGSGRAGARVATGYTLGAHGARPVTEPLQVTMAAGSACSTPRDMARYVAALLGGGTNEHGSVLNPPTLAAMFGAHYQPDPRIPGMGLAFFRGEAGGHRVVEHGGLVPGFDSQIVLAPDDGVGVLAFCNGTRGGMFSLPTMTNGLLRAELGVPEEEVRTDLPHHPEIWADLCGRYLIGGPLTDARARAMAGAGVQVVVRRGRLVLRVLTPVPSACRGFPLHPDDDEDPYAFRIDLSRYGMATGRVVFSPGAGAAATAISFDRGQLLTAWRSGSRRGTSAPAEGAGRPQRLRPLRSIVERVATAGRA